MIYILIITIMIYLTMIVFVKKRTAIAILGSGILLILGSITSLFDVGEAFSKFPGEIVILIIVLTLFTDVFNRLGCINFIGYKFIELTGGNKVYILIIIPIIIYVTSLFMNNLTVVLLFTFMVLHLAVEYSLPIVPVLVSVVIASNIGGAPLPWADTPAVVLTLYTNFNLVDFLNKMFLPCMIYAILLSVYTYFWYKYFWPHERNLPFRERPNVDWKKSRVYIILFIIYIIAVSIGPFINISIAYISLLFGGLLLVIEERSVIDILDNLPILDSLVFIIALFLIGGVLETSGILKMSAEYVIGLTNGEPYLLTIAVLFMAFIISTFLSAGPAAATLLPLCVSLVNLVPFKLIYAAMALGILAGSSMLPWSATGGPILLSQTNKFLNEIKLDDSYRKRIEQIYNIKHYLLFSIPFSLVILLLSGGYLTLFIRFLLK